LTDIFGRQVIKPALPDDNFAAPLRVGLAEFDRHRPNVTVVSCRGGSMAMDINNCDGSPSLLPLRRETSVTASSVERNTTIVHPG